MIPFFRKIRKQMADDKRPLQYMRYAIGEIVLVVIGILIALQVNNWNESRNQKQVERKLLTELRKDLLETMADLETDVAKANSDLQWTDSLFALVLRSQSKVKSQPIKISYRYVYNRSALYAKKSAYESLQAHGINLVSNDSLRKSITDFFELQLIRISDLEKVIKEMNEKELSAYLISVSRSTTECEDCTSLKDMFGTREAIDSNTYLIPDPQEELLHMLKRKYMAYTALLRLYNTTQSKMEQLIELIDAETKP